MPAVPFARVWRRLDPRRSIAARLLFGFFLAFLLPGSAFVFLMQRRLTALEADSAAQVAAVRVSEAEMRVEQDIGFRAEWVERRARVAEESAWALAAAAAPALAGDLAPVPDGSRLAPDAHGHVWTEIPEEESMALVSGRAVDAEAARRQAGRTRVLAPLMAELRRRRPAIRDVSIWTAEGAMRHSPWLDFHRANRESGGELERFVFNRVARFPAARPATGDEAVWTGVYAGPSITSDPRTASVFVPVRNAAGALVAGIALDLDPRRYVAEAFETWQPPGDIWFATDAAGHALLMTPRAAAALGWSGVGGSVIADAPSPELKKLAARALRGQRSAEPYIVDGKALRIASARVGATGWVLFEGFSREAVDTIRAEAVRAFPPASYSSLRHEVLLLFALLSLAVLGTIGLVSRRISAPVGELVRAAEEIGRGRSYAIAARASGDEVGRLASAIDTMGKRVERRVETLRRLHQFSRSAYRMTDFKEVLGRSTQAIAAFTNAERVWFHLYDRNTNRLEAALPGVERHGGDRGEAEGVGGRPFDRGHGVPDRRGLLRQRPRPGPVQQPRAPEAGGRGERRLRAAQDRGGDARRRRRDQPAGRVRPGGDRRGDVLRGPLVAPAAQRAALHDARPHGRRAAPRGPAQGPLPAERQPRAAHAADRDRGLDRPLRGGGRARREDACAADCARSGSRRGCCSP